MNTRNFRVRGLIQSMFTPSSGTPESKTIANLQVELWHKGAMEIIFLGKALTASDGEFIIDFAVESPSAMIENGKINEVFLKVLQGERVIIGDVSTEGSSFD